MSGLRARLLRLPTLAMALALVACSTVDPRAGKSVLAPASQATTDAVAPPGSSASPGAVLPSGRPPAKRPGGYYQDDGPADMVPEGLRATPDAEPKIEPIAKGPNRPYTVFDKTYVPIVDDRAFVQRGVGSWYGKKFHGQKTASGEIYDMFKMTAAHPTLPIPSYARVTNLTNGRKVIVRINDRGPFHALRVIDLSYTAALKLDVLRGGSAELEVERLLAAEILRMQALRQSRREPQASSGTEAPVSRTAAPVKSADPAVSSAGFYLQFGAYTLEQNAQGMREYLVRNWPAGLPAPVIIPSKGMFRLHSGPFESREQADDAARQVRDTSAIRSTLVQR